MPQGRRIRLACRQRVAAYNRVEELRQAVDVEQLTRKALFLVGDHREIHALGTQADQRRFHLREKSALRATTRGLVACKSRHDRVQAGRIEWLRPVYRGLRHRHAVSKGPGHRVARAEANPIADRRFRQSGQPIELQHVVDRGRYFPGAIDQRAVEVECDEVNHCRPPPGDGARRASKAETVSSTTAVTRSDVRPRCRYTSGAGADSPKLETPTTAPSKPTYLCQRSGCDASIAIVGNSRGSTLLRYF